MADEKVMDNGGEGYALKFESLLYDLLYHLYVNFGRRNNRAIPATVREEEDRLKKVLDYTKRHYREPISLKEISGVIHLQPEYFCRYFKRCMGMTYLEYLNEVRLSGIYEDLIHTDWPLYKILKLHGFKNYKLFRKLFYRPFRLYTGTVSGKSCCLWKRNEFRNNGGMKIMKFQNGAWLMKEGHALFAPQMIYEMDQDENSVTLILPTNGFNLQSAVLTMKITAPMPEMIRVQTCHYMGVRQDNAPAFDLNLPQKGVMQVEDNEKALTIKSGHLSLVIDKENWSMSYERDGKLLTKSAGRDPCLCKDGLERGVLQL